MSTYYDFNESNWMEEIKMHYAHNTDIEFDTVCYCDEFIDEDVEFAQDVFIGDVKTTYITTLEEDELTIFDMPTTTFKAKWSEKVWDKFRQDTYTAICPKCGEKMAHSVAGATLSDIGKIEQFHCDGCNYTWVGYSSGKFIREGVLKSGWDVH